MEIPIFDKRSAKTSNLLYLNTDFNGLNGTIVLKIFNYSQKLNV